MLEPPGHQLVTLAVSGKEVVGVLQAAVEEARQDEARADRPADALRERRDRRGGLAGGECCGCHASTVGHERRPHMVQMSQPSGAAY